MKHKIYFLMSLVFLLVINCKEEDDPPVPPAPSVDVDEEVKKLAYSTLVKYNLPGIIVSIADHNTNRIKDAFYNQSGSNLTSNSVFRIGSVTKPMVAVLLLRLHELGKIDIAAPIQTTPYRITTINLLNHTAGLGNFLSSPIVSGPGLSMVQPNYQWSFEELMSLSIPTAPFVHTYSNTGYLVAGRVAEIASDNAFNPFLTPQLHTLLKEHVFNKAGMVTALYQENNVLPSDMAVGVDGTLLGNINVTNVHPSVYNSAGAVIASTTDLHRFLRSLFNEQLIKRSSLNAMMSLNTVASGPNQLMGLGIFIENNTTIGKKYSHTGLVPGYSCVIAYYEKYNKSIVIATNTNTDGLGTRAIVNALSQTELLLPYP